MIVTRRVPAAGDPQLLRRRRVARHVDRVLRRGLAARHRRLRPARDRPPRRHLPRHLRRRALRRRPDEARRVPPREGRRRHDRPQVGRQPARVRDRRHRRGGPDRALPREAVAGARSSRTRSTPASTWSSPRCCGTSRPTGPTTSRRSSSRCCSRWAGRSTATRWTATGRTSATSTSTGRRTSTRSTSSVQLNVPGIRLRGNVWIGEGVELDDARGGRGAGVHRQLLPHLAATRRSGRTRCSANSRHAARARAHRPLRRSTRRRYIGRSALIEGAIVGRSCDIRSHVRIHEGVAIGDEVTLGAQSVVMPGVRIYPYKEVESGAQIHESLIWESRACSRLFGKDGVSGLVNVDLTPETAVRLAAALGTALKRGARVVASRESHSACRMIKRAMISGLNSTGVDVADLRVAARGGQPPPAEDARLRRRLPRRLSHSNPEVVADPLLRAARDPADAGAAEGDREELHAPGAAPRPASTRSARSPTRPASARATPRTCSRRSTPSAIRARGFRIVVDYGYSAASFVLPLAARAARRRGGHGARLRDRAQRRRRGSCASRSARRSGSSSAIGGELGVVFDRAGERLLLVDEQRPRDLGRADAAALPAPARASAATRARLAFPVTVTRLVEELARAAAGSRSSARRTRSPS